LGHEHDPLRPDEIQPADRSARLACARLISEEPPTGHSTIAGSSPLVREDPVEPLAAFRQTSEVLFELSTTTLNPCLARLRIMCEVFSRPLQGRHTHFSSTSISSWWQGQSGAPYS